MAEIAPATEEGPARRRRDSWNLRTIVEDVTGRSIEEMQDPSRPVHPFLKSVPPPAASAGHRVGVTPLASGDSFEGTDDPVARIHPPLVGETGRAFHGSEHEHHQPTLDEMATAAEPPSPGIRPHTPGPSQRPERIYLHYLLLHMDRLSDSALKYLQRAVDEEAQHRQL